MEGRRSKDQKYRVNHDTVASNLVVEQKKGNEIICTFHRKECHVSDRLNGLNLPSNYAVKTVKYDNVTLD